MSRGLIDSDIRERKELLVGGLLGMGILSLCLLCFLALWYQGLFVKKYTLHCIFTAKNAQHQSKDSTESPVMGVNTDSRVLINGVEVGRVDSVVLQKNGDVRLRLEIRSEYADHIRSNSVAFPIRERNIISDRVINISHGDAGVALLDGDTLQTATPRDIESFIVQARLLLEQVERLVNASDTLIKMAGNPKSSLGSLLASDKLYVDLLTTITQLSELTQESSGLIGDVRSDAPKLLHKANRLADELSAITQQGKNTLERTNHTIEQASGFVKNSDTLVQSTRVFLDKSLPLIIKTDTLLGLGQKTLIKTNSTLDSISIPWLLFRKSVPK